MEDIRIKKTQFRKRYLRMRKALSRQSVEMRSYTVMNNLRNLIVKCEVDFKSIMLYVPINNEVDVLWFARELWQKGKELLFPSISDKDEIVPKQVSDFYNDFKMGKYKIPEPDTKCYTGVIDICVVPGVAFDKNGYRLGYGKGYYDRFLSSYDIRCSVGVAFDFQIVKFLPIDNKDQRLDFIVGEHLLIDAKNKIGGNV